AGLTVTVDTVAPSAPAAPNLQPGSDSGQSDSDNTTNQNDLTFNVTASPHFRFYRDGGLISAAFESGGSYTAASGSAGSFAYAIPAEDAAGNESALSPALNVTIDTTAPTASIDAVSPDPRTTSVDAIAIAFNEAVFGFDLRRPPAWRRRSGAVPARRRVRRHADHHLPRVGRPDQQPRRDGRPLRRDRHGRDRGLQHARRAGE